MPAAKPQHIAVSLWLTVGLRNYFLGCASIAEAQPHTFLGKGTGKIEPFRSVLRRSRKTPESCLLFPLTNLPNVRILSTPS